jgi:hypothetical protein
MKYLLRKPSRKLAPFTFGWLLALHREMLSHIPLGLNPMNLLA